jgi:class 3 adenylate cyclase/predicted ATPase
MISKQCPGCGFANLLAAKFCAQCAAPLSAAAGTQAAVPVRTEPAPPEIPLDAERRTITALFADIKSSTELMRDLDPEEARAIIDPALHLMIEAVRTLEGYVVQSTGDGIFALFGAPIAHEDHPQRAIRAALAMQQGLGEYAARLRSEGRPSLEARIGVNTGEVVVREIHTGRHAEYTPIGHTANLAARLQAIAPPGSIALSEQTRMLVEGYFELRPLGPVQVKGLNHPVEAWQVIGSGPLQSHFEVSLKRGLTRFIGRYQEIEQIERSLEIARTGRGQIVAVIGEPGVGKSRLLHQFKQTRPAGCLMLEAAALSHGAGIPYHLVIELLRNYFGLLPEDTHSRRREKVESKIAAHGLHDTLPYICALLGLPCDSLDDPGGERRRRTIDAVKRLLLMESRRQPLVAVFEDLHWLDRESLLFLSVMSSSIATASILGLVSFRPEFRHEFTNHSYYKQIHLNPLDAGEAGQMVQSYPGQRQALRELEQFVVDKSEGNPFFIEEIVQALFAQKVLVRGDTVKLSRPLSEARIPPTVQAILASRVDRLDPQEKDLLQAMAVIGRAAPLKLIELVLRWPRKQLEHMFSHLQFLEFLHEQATAAGAEYVLKHALTQDVVYNSLLREQRAALHERAAQAIETLYPDRIEDHLDELAHHYGRSRNSVKAVHYLQRAGVQALARSALANGVAHLNRALELLRSLDHHENRARQELDLLLLLGPALMASEGYGSSKVEEIYTRARELCHKFEDTPQLCAVLYGLFGLYNTRADYRTADEAALEMVRLAEKLKQPVLLVLANFAAGQTRFLLGEPSQSRAYFERTAASYSPECQHEMTLVAGFDCGIAAMVWDSLALWMLGHPDGALRRIEQALALARQMAQPHSVVYTLFFTAWLHHFRREWRAAVDTTRTVIALAAEHSLPLWRLWAATLQGSAMVEAGQTHEGLDQMIRGLEATRAAGARISITATLGLLAQAHARADDPLRGLAVVDEGLEAARSSGEAYYLAELHRIRGELLLAARISNQALAEQCFSTSIQIARRQKANSWELRSATSFARLLGEQGHKAEARAALATIYSRFTEGLDTTDVVEAKALLQKL